MVSKNPKEEAEKSVADDRAMEAKSEAIKQAMLVGKHGLVMTDLSVMYRFAEYVVTGGFAPKGMENPCAVVAAMQLGMELGLPPMVAIHNIAVINGRPTVWGDVMKGLVEASGLCVSFVEWTEGNFPNDDYTAFCEVRRKGRDQTIRGEFSIEDAKRAQLWGKQSRDGKPSPWILYPKRMLKFRARSYSCRDGFPDILKGIYAREEMYNVQTYSTEEINVTDTVPAPIPKEIEKTKAEELAEIAERAKTNNLDKPEPEREKKQEPETETETKTEDPPFVDEETGEVLEAETIPKGKKGNGGSATQAALF